MPGMGWLAGSDGNKEDAMASAPEETIQRFLREVEEAIAPRLRGAILYGSGAGAGFVPGRSDLNFLLIVDSVDLDLLAALQSRLPGWERRRIATPLVVEPAFLPGSTDSYPLEILGMLTTYRVLKGEDPLASLEIEPRHVRLQTEREVKAKTLLLRRGCLESCGKHQRLRAVLAGALPAVEAILRGVLFLEGRAWRSSGAALHAAGVELLGPGAGILASLQRLRERGGGPNRDDTIRAASSLLDLLAAIGASLERRGTDG